MLRLADAVSHPSTARPRSASVESRWAHGDRAEVPRKATEVTELGERTTPNNSEPEPPPLSANAEVYRPYLERQFLQQALDASWARQAQSELETGLGLLLDQRSFMTPIACRSSLCRVELTHQDERAYASFVDTFTHVLFRIWKGPGFVSKQGETRRGEWIMVMFLAREGTKLPDE